MLGPILLFFALFFSFPYKFLPLSFVFILVLNYTLHFYTYDLYCIPDSHKSWSVSMKMNTNCVKLMLHYNTRQQCVQDWALVIWHKMAELWVNVNLVKLILRNLKYQRCYILLHIMSDHRHLIFFKVSFFWKIISYNS